MTNTIETLAHGISIEWSVSCRTASDWYAVYGYGKKAVFFADHCATREDAVREGRVGALAYIETVRRRDTMTHSISYESKDAVEFGAPVTLQRAVCGCGWKGCWYTQKWYTQQIPSMLRTDAEFSGERHLLCQGRAA